MSDGRTVPDCLIEDLIAATRDSAAFADDKPHGRSRSASLRRLRAVIQRIDETATDNTTESASAYL